MNPIVINYVLLAEFAALAIGWYWTGDRWQATYWTGALICTAGVTFK
jgi:drug/metabolite transporter (DMT)-like permease